MERQRPLFFLIYRIYLSLYLYYKKENVGLCAREDVFSLVYNLSILMNKHKHRNEHMYMCQKYRMKTLWEKKEKMEMGGEGDNKIKQSMMKVR